ncbi:MAG TPA: threonine--tRNA ligase, partial [Propionibacteriaceae bacterium]|nr:threonine--tRNA ligase [Propionibacteriaceae bacterium]
MPSISLVSPGQFETRELTGTTTGLELFGDDQSVVAMKVNGATLDLARQVADGDTVEPVVMTSDEGLAIIRHSCAHVAAQAVQSLRADAKLGIGPPITDGFYYDFD